MNKLIPLSLLLAVAPPPAIAQECTNANSVSGGATTIPVLIGAGTLTLADSGARVNDYAIRLGALDQYATLCVLGTAPTTLVFDLSGSNQNYAFEDIRYGFPAGFAPSDSPFKLSVVGNRTINVHFQGSRATLGRTFEYNLILRNTSTGERLILDPPINNKPN